ncbi:hypothetical protein GCM10010399_28540 [Dactylosporangium fulvum]|uniref:Uncharacterized protein n=1 Tax=Dactylosporangium fulvum TaxID=53359 RepID=A0ABY5WDB6_9ACTN|nr:hypothetical protein [Dactylosporangium fulvum]UWP86276.1 hypothetical protein Dfulv_19345 [Dactylosporangium fulvum]
MSVIASFTVLDAKFLPDFAADPAGVLATHGRAVSGEYGWSGYVVLAVLDALEDRGISLSDTGHGEPISGLDDDSFSTLLTPEHRRYLPHLDPAGIDAAEFKAIFDEEGLELDEYESGAAGRATVALIRDLIAALTDDEVVVVYIG